MATNLSNIQRVALVHNTALSRVGTKHYAHALLKCTYPTAYPLSPSQLTSATDNIIPTVPGPFQVLKEIEKLESTTAKPPVVEKLQQTLGIKKKSVVRHTLCKTNGSGQTGRVTVSIRTEPSTRSAADACSVG